MKTIDERAEEYVNQVHLSKGTYKGDVVTAYCMGASDQEKLKKLPFLMSFWIDRRDNPLQYKLVFAYSEDEASLIIKNTFETRIVGSAYGGNHRVVDLFCHNL